MTHTPLLPTLVIGLVLAFILGAIANRFRISPLIGYMLAGVAVGPHTPGFVANQALARDLAEVGVILLMFGVGLQFSPKELLSVKAIAIPGAVMQAAVSTAFGTALGLAAGWSLATALVFGLALSIASTVVVIRLLDEQHLIESAAGRISVGWLIVEDLVMVLVMVLLPTIAAVMGEAGASDGGPDGLSWQALGTAVAIAIGKVAAFVAALLIIGQRVIPWLLHNIAHTGSRELFRLGVLAVALGVAFGAAELVGVSFALGAFFAGLVLSESELSQRAAAETLPLRDAFAVLFFVSVGMLFDPGIFVREPWLVLGAIAVISVAKPVAVFAIMRGFGYSLEIARIVAASRTQIGEFSFILSGLAVALGLLPEQARDLVLAGAMLSIVATPAMFLASGYVTRRLTARRDPAGTDAFAEPSAPADEAAPGQIVHTGQQNHAVIVGSGRVGGFVAESLRQRGESVLLIEERLERVEELRESGFEVIYGHVPAADVMAAANLAAARWLFFAIPDAFEAGRGVEMARSANPDLLIVSRAHSDAEFEHLEKYGSNITILGELELAQAMLAQALEARDGAAGRAGAARDGASDS